MNDAPTFLGLLQTVAPFLYFLGGVVVVVIVYIVLEHKNNKNNG